MFNALTAVKFAVSGIVGIGTGKIVGGVIKNNISPETLIDKVTVTAAAWVIGAMATKATKTHTDEMIDEVYEGVTKVYRETQDKNKLSRINAGTSTWEKEGLDRDDYVMNADAVWVLRMTMDEPDHSDKDKPQAGSKPTMY